MIDLAGLDDPGSKDFIARQLALHSRITGWALLKNHGLPHAHVQRVTSVARSLLDEPAEDLKKWTVGTDRNDFVGYASNTKIGLESIWLSGKPGKLLHNKDRLPLWWHPHLEPIEYFKLLCQELVDKIQSCFDHIGMAMHLDSSPSEMTTRNDSPVSPISPNNPEPAVQMRVHRYTPNLSGISPLTDYKQTGLSTSKGSLVLAFVSAAVSIEVEAHGDQWRSPPAEADGDLVYVYLADAIPFWSRGQAQAATYRLAWRDRSPDAEKFIMTYLATKSEAYNLPADLIHLAYGT